MTAVTFVKLTGFRDVASTQPLEAWVNPERIAYFKPVHLGQARTRIFFAEDGTLEVAETPAEVIVALQWCGLEPARAPHNGNDDVDADYEAALAEWQKERW